MPVLLEHFVTRVAQGNLAMDVALQEVSKQALGPAQSHICVKRLLQKPNAELHVSLDSLGRAAASCLPSGPWDQFKMQPMPCRKFVFVKKVAAPVTGYVVLVAIQASDKAVELNAISTRLLHLVHQHVFRATKQQATTLCLALLSANLWNMTPLFGGIGQPCLTFALICRYVARWLQEKMTSWVTAKTATVLCSLLNNHFTPNCCMQLLEMNGFPQYPTFPPTPSFYSRFRTIRGKWFSSTRNYRF